MATPVFGNVDTETLRATYQNGTLKLVAPLDVLDDTEVIVTVEGETPLSALRPAAGMLKVDPPEETHREILGASIFHDREGA